MFIYIIFQNKQQNYYACETLIKEFHLTANHFSSYFTHCFDFLTILNIFLHVLVIFATIRKQNSNFLKLITLLKKITILFLNLMKLISFTLYIDIITFFNHI